MVVSHDRYFIDRVVDNVLVVDNGAAGVYPGNYSDHVERVKAGIAVPRAPEVVAPKPPSAPLPAERGEGARRAGEGQRAEQKKREKQLKKIDEEIAALEARIASAERERERNDFLLCSEEVYRDGERTRKIQAQNADLKAMIELLIGKWEALAKQREELENAVA